MGQEVNMYYEWHDRLPSVVMECGEMGLKRALMGEFDRHLYLYSALGFVPLQRTADGQIWEHDPDDYAQAKDFITTEPNGLVWIEKDSPTYRLVRLGAYPAILIENPDASEATEPIFVLIIQARTLRYFALELPALIDDTDPYQTKSEGFLCEWTLAGDHRNFGPCELAERDFLSRIRQILIRN